MKTHLLPWLLALGLAAGACTCGEDRSGIGREPVSEGDGQQGRDLEPVPEAPTLKVDRESLAGEDGELEVVVSRPQGPVRGEVRPTVTFSLPVKALADVEGQRASDQARPFARIEPALEGEWRWLGSATAEFVPKGQVPYSTLFRVTVLRGLRAIDGSELAEDHVFSFHTPVPQLQDVSPVRTHAWLRPDQPFKLLFNQPVKDLPEHAQLRVEGEAQPRRVRVVKTTSIAEERAQQGPRTGGPGGEDAPGLRNQQTRYELSAERALPLDRAITLSIDAGLRGEQGPLTLAAPIELNWRTYGPLRVERAAFCGDYPCPHGPLVLSATNPLDLEALRERLELSPEVELDWEASSVVGPRTRIAGAFVPGTTYQVTVRPGARDTFGQQMPQAFTADARTPDLEPQLITGGPNALVEAGQGPSLPVEVVNLRSLDVALWNLTPAEAARALSRGVPTEGLGRGPDFTARQTLSYPPNLRRLHRIDLAPIFGAAKTGLALVRVNSPDLRHRPEQGYPVVVQVTDLAAHLKLGPSRSAIWVTRLSSGQGAADATLSLVDGAGNVRWSGTTDAKGMADVPGAVELNLPGADGWSTPFVMVTATVGEDTGISESSWSDGVNAWDFNLEAGWEGQAPQSAGFVFTDRGIYRPGDTVHLKGVARYRAVGALKAPSEGSKLTLVIRDSRGEEQSRKVVKVSAHGTFNLDAALPAKAPIGWYQAEATGTAPGGDLHFHGTFQVAEYRAPQFKVDVAATRPSLLAGEALQATVQARYLFGAAMSDAKVRWSVHRNSESFTPAGLDEFSFVQQTWWWDDGEPGEQGGFFGSGEGRVDARGGLQIEAGAVETPGERTYGYTVEAEVEDVNRQAVAGRAKVTVHPSSFYVGVRPPLGFGQAGKPVAVAAVVTDTTGSRVGGRSFEVEVIRRSWRSVRQKGAGGGLTTVSEPFEEQVHRCPLRSEPKTPVDCTFTPSEAGFYIVRGALADDQGRRHSATTGMYVTGSDFVAWQRNDTDRIELVPDKSAYQVGEVAKVLVKSPYPKARAWVTVEREGVLDRKVVEFSGSVSTVEVPITDAMVPNVFLGVLMVRPRVGQGGLEGGEDPGRPAVRVGLVKLPVERSTKRLSVEVRTDKEEYRPGEEVTVRLAVKDHLGRGAPAELTVYAVDEGVLRLTGYKTPDPIASIFPERPLSVRLGEPLLHLVRARSYGEKGEEEGGGGGRGEGIALRSDFKTTAFYRPDLLAGADGTATVKFKLPDNLTTFRVMAVAVSKDDRFGSGERELKVAKPLLALPALPRFARVGDRFEAGVVVHSHRSGDGEVTVTAEVENARLEGPGTRKVQVGEGSPREVRFAFIAEAAGTATFRFKVSRGTDSDGVEQKIPVELPVGWETVATAGDTKDQRVEGISLPKDARPGVGGLEVTLASTALVNFQEGFRQLVEYPYGCLEQQTSRLVPFVALRELAPKFGIAWERGLSDPFVRDFLFDPAHPAAQQPDPDRVIDGTLASILELQTQEGAFNFWPGAACPSSHASAYATFALHRAKQVGFEVPPQRLARAQAYLQKVAGGSCSPCELGCPDETRVFAAWVLARSGRPQASHYGAFFARKDQLSLFSRALLADAMFVGGGNREQARKLLQELLNHAKESPRGVHFEEVQSQTYAALWHSDARTTGAVLQTLATVSPDHPYVGKIAQYLTSARKGGRWRTTQEAAFSLIGLTELVRVKEKDAPSFSARVLLGDQALAEQRFEGRSTGAVTRQIPMQQLLEGKADQRLTFKKEGPGVLYYSASLKHAPMQIPMKAQENGLYVQRWFEPFEGGGQATRFRAGDLVRVRLRVASNQQRHYAVFEVPLPAGLEPVDTSLATTARLGRSADEEGPEGEYQYEDEEDQYGGAAEGPQARSPWSRSFWSPFNHLEQRDDRVMLFADHLPPGVHATSFVARATTPGTFMLKPAHGELMYEPEVSGRSGGGTFEVVFPTEVSRR